MSVRAALSKNPCGETGIRTPETLLEFTRFPGVPLQPLEHLSFIWLYLYRVCSTESRYTTDYTEPQSVQKRRKGTKKMLRTQQCVVFFEFFHLLATLYTYDDILMTMRAMSFPKYRLPRAASLYSLCRTACGAIAFLCMAIVPVAGCAFAAIGGTSSTAAISASPSSV